MRVAFIMPDMEWLSYEYLSASLKQNIPDIEIRVFHDPQVFGPSYFHIPFLERLFDIHQQVLNDIELWEPDMIGITVLTSTFPWALYLAGQLKQRRLQAPIVFGGTHVTLVPERVLRHSCVDFGCVGEGEDFIVEFVRSMQNGNIDYTIPGMVYRKNGDIHMNSLRVLSDDMDALPWPDKDVVYEAAPFLKVRQLYQTLASRGCPYTCTYCSHSKTNAVFKGVVKPVRRRTVHDVIAELKTARAKHNMTRIFFFDEVFTLSEQWLEEFAAKYREEINLPFWCDVHPRNINDRIIELLEYANCGHIQIGIESVNETVRKELFNRMYSNEELVRALDKLRKTRMYVSTDIIIQLPGQTPEQVLNESEFFTDHPVDAVEPYFLRYFAGTKLADDALQQGIISTSQYDAIHDGVLSVSKNNTGYDLQTARQLGKQQMVTKVAGTDSKDMDRLRSLLVMTPFLPKSLYRFIRNRNLWKYLPAWNLSAVFTVLTLPWLKWVRHKKRIIADMHPLHYMVKIMWVTRKKFKRVNTWGQDNFS